ncbi:MAG: elongation factor 1-beta [Candidatus Thermoplasmatota archaeon]
MGVVVGLIRVMPSEVLDEGQMEEMKKEIEKVVKSPAKLGRIDTKNVAFGLKGLDVTVSVPDEEGGIDPIADEIAKIKNVETAEVTDVGRM